MPKARLKKEPAPTSLPGEATVTAGPLDSVAPGAGTAHGKHGKSKVPLYAVAFLAVAACTLYFVWHASSRETGAKSDAENTLPLEGFVVDLGGGGPRAYLRVGITLGFSRALPRKREDLPMAALRDAALAVLSSAQPEQLLAPEGKQKLKAVLLEALQERAPELGFDNVYFTEFLVQM
jgi:flagellar basal body-associated protein FliL